MAKHSFDLNGRAVSVDVAPDMPLLWVLRDVLQLTGTKYGCGIMQCGACTVHLDGRAVRTCQLPVSAVAGHAVTTIEGLGSGGLHAVQVAWIDEQVPQCGYCQSGQIMAAAALLKRTPRPTPGEVDEAMVGNICRCGTYPRIRRAIEAAIRRAAGALDGVAGAGTEPDPSAASDVGAAGDARGPHE